MKLLPAQETLKCFCHAGVRVDTWIETGTEVTPFYDSLLAKLMVFGKSRQEAVTKLRAALAATSISGIPTNLEYHAAIAASEKFAAGASWVQTSLA